MNPSLFILLTICLSIGTARETVLEESMEGGVSGAILNEETDNSSFIGEINAITYQSVSIVSDNKLDNLNDSTCEIHSPLNETVVKPPLDGKCYYTIIDVKKNESDGEWSIIGLTGNQTKFKTNFTINVLEYPQHKFDIDLLSGSAAELTFGPEDALYCQYKMLDSDEIVRHNGQCVVKIDKVSKTLHDGIWSVEVGVPTSMSGLHYVYSVNVHQLSNQKSGITTYVKITNDTIEMSCMLPIKEMKSCKFVRSDGVIWFINKYLGVGNYEYFVGEKQLQDKNVTYAECGMRIRNPNDIDRDPWKCFIVHELNDNQIETGSWVQTKYYAENVTEDNFIHSVKNITTILKNEVNILCEYSKPIAYCWFRSPNGTQFSLFESTNNSNYKYYGEGFGVGQCGIKIKSASQSDTGNWRCNVGKIMGDSMDPVSSIKVTVLGSPFQPKAKEMIWYKGINVSCQMYDNSPLEYCRFIRPDGQGINPTAIRHIKRDFYPDHTNLEMGICEINVVANLLVNIGRWRCIAKPLNKEIEYSNDFYLYAHYWSYDEKGANAFLCIIAVMGIIGLIFLIRLLVVRHSTERTGRNRHPTIVNQSQSYPPPYSFAVENQDATVKNSNLVQ